MRLSYTLPVLLLSLLSCESKKENSTAAKKDAPPVVDVIVANPQSIDNTLEANGTIVAAQFVEVRPEISGRLTYLNIAEGSTVSRGTVLAKVNDADLKAQLNKVQVQLKLANATLDRYSRLLEIQGINKADYDVALAQVSSYQADINVLQAEMAKTIVRAPFTGVLGLRQVSNGAYVSPQTVLTTLQQMGSIRVDFTLPEAYTNLLKKGQTVVVEADAIGGTRRRATIIAIEPQISTSTRNVLIRARLDESAGINPGSFVKVYVDAGDANSIMVPASAIIPDASAKFLVLVKDGKASFTEIKTGIRNAGGVQVTSGLEPGDSVVVTGVLFARPNTPVTVRSVKTLADLLK